MSNRHTVQHRQQRDSGNREISELKQEVNSLKRRLARANREIERLQGVVEEDPQKPIEKPESAACPKCGSSDLGQIATPTGKRVVACRGCRKWRSRAA